VDLFDRLLTALTDAHHDQLDKDYLPHADERCDTRSHVLRQYVDWRFGLMSET
jgi:hypothetical protein